MTHLTSVKNSLDRNTTVGLRLQNALLNEEIVSLREERTERDVQQVAAAERIRTLEAHVCDLEFNLMWNAIRYQAAAGSRSLIPSLVDSPTHSDSAVQPTWPAQDLAIVEECTQLVAQYRIKGVLNGSSE